MLGAVAVLVSGAAIVLFAAGEDLFGSDPGTIDSYNRETLDSCRVPSDSSLVQASIRPVTDDAGQRYRSMWYVFASPLPADDVAEFFGVTNGVSMVVSLERACRFGQRPSVLVLSSSDAGEPAFIGPETDTDGMPISTYDGLWADQAAEVWARADPPAGTRSFFRLRVAQREVDGVF